MANKASSNESGYSCSAHVVVRRMICEALDEQGERKVGYLTDNRGKKAFIVLLEELNTVSKQPVFEATEQTAFIDFVIG